MARCQQKNTPYGDKGTHLNTVYMDMIHSWIANDIRELENRHYEIDLDYQEFTEIKYLQALLRELLRGNL